MQPVSGSRTLLLVANRARPDGQIPLDDLTGRGGRFDLVARFVNASLLTSHGIREDAQAIVVFTEVEEPVALRMRGDAVTGIGPDERSTAARLASALDAVAMPVWQEVADGIDLRAGELEEILASTPAPRVLLHEEGEGWGTPGAGAATFVIGDHQGFSPKQRERLAELCAATVQLGSRALQADQVATIVHHELDRDPAGPES